MSDFLSEVSGDSFFPSCGGRLDLSMRVCGGFSGGGLEFGDEEDACFGEEH